MFVQRRLVVKVGVLRYGREWHSRKTLPKAVIQMRVSKGVIDALRLL
jgi:hypothetical protein